MDSMAKFVIRKVISGFKFDLLAANGEKILTSEVYSSQSACEKGLSSVRKNAAAAPVEDQTSETAAGASNPKFELFQDRGGKFRFRLRSRNGKTIAVSDAYVTKAGCRSGIESVVKNAAGADVEEE